VTHPYFSVSVFAISYENRHWQLSHRLSVTT